MKQFKILLFVLLLYNVASSQSGAVQQYSYKDNSFPWQVNIGDSLAKRTFPGAWLEVGDSLNTKKGILPPRGFTGDIIQTTEGLFIYDRLRKTLAVRNDTGWLFLGNGTGTVDISGKLNKSDTAAMLAPYLRIADTTNKWVIDLYTRNDSLFKFKNGIEDFAGIRNVSTIPPDGYSGCNVIYTNIGLVYRVTTPCSYNINGIGYSLASPVDITIANGTASAGEFRQDAIVVNTSATATSILGTNSTGGVGSFPVYDKQTELLLTYIRVDENQTTNTQVSVKKIFDENTGTAGGEFAATVTGATVNANATTAPSTGTKHAAITAFANGNTLLYTDNVTHNTSEFYYITGDIRINTTAWDPTVTYSITLMNGTTPITGVLSVKSYGINPSLLNTYQSFSIPVGAFNFTGNGTRFNIVRITRSGNAQAANWYLDNLNFQSGLSMVGPQQNSIGSITTQSGTVTSNAPNYNVKLVGTDGINTTASNDSVKVSGANLFVSVYKKPDTDSVFGLKGDGTSRYLFLDKDGRGYNVLDSAYKSDLSRTPWIWGSTVKGIGNSWITGGFSSGTFWTAQIASYFGVTFNTSAAVNGDDSRGMVKQAFANMSIGDSAIYFADPAWLDIGGTNPPTGGAGDSYGYNDKTKSYYKSMGNYKAMFANYFLKEFHLFEDLSPTSGSFTAQTTTDSTWSKATVNSKHVMKGQGTYSFVKPKHAQSMAIGFLNTDGIKITGGTINVYVKGKLFTSYNTNEKNNAGWGWGSPGGKWLYNGLSYDAIILHNLPQDSATITVTTTTADVWLDYYGYLYTAYETEKPIYANFCPYLTGSNVLINFNTSRNSVDSLNLAKLKAAEYFPNYPIFLTNIQSNIVAADFTTPANTFHLAGTGSDKVANFYKQNLVPSYYRSGTNPNIDTSSGGVGGGGDALTTNPLSQFASTTSAQLRGVLSDETGTGNAVFATSPALTTPTISVGSDATGDIYYRNSGGAFTRLPIGSNGQHLKVVSGIPAWVDTAAAGGGGPSLSGNNTWTGDNVFNKNTVFGVSTYASGMLNQVTINYDGSQSYGARGIRLNDKFNGGDVVIQVIGGSNNVYFTSSSGGASRIVASGLQNPSTGNYISGGGNGFDVVGDRFSIGGMTYTGAAFQVNSTTRWSLAAPPMTNTQKGSLSGLTAGAQVYCTDCTASDASTGVLQVYNGSTWKNAW